VTVLSPDSSGGTDWRYLVQAGAVAGLVLVVLAAYPVWVALAGPAHIVGPAQTVQLLKGLSTDVLTPIVPTIEQRFSFGFAWTGTRLVAEHGATLGPDVAENGGYIGIPLLVLLMVGVAALWRRPLVRFATAMGVAALVISMGAELHYDSRFLGVPLPFAVLLHVPLLDSQIASRYSVYMWLFVALLVAMIADVLYRRLREKTPVAALLCVLVVGAALFPLVPSWPYGSGETGTPAWYLSSYARQVPLGSTLVSYPFPSVGSATPMLWQAEAGMRFKMPGGYVISPGPGRRATFDPPYNALSNAFMECGAGIDQPPVTPQTVAEVRSELRSWNVDTIVVPRSAKYAQCVLTFVAGVLGPPRSESGSEVWTSLWSRSWMRHR